ncbi:DUF2125 domain-containing protein [uncultured Cohaesibacter sp.]|uniref:DUF2125 domain-containing protein n=1 Tax=uncultured Cohaesibacter sp. TaxID=1002546 RepID=UPI002930039C|nr:DUF2125 domain-containing protein [uncultured Cohaesibacter sp.]
MQDESDHFEPQLDPRTRFDEEKQKTPRKRKYTLLVTSLLVLFALWSAAWYAGFTVANKAADRIVSLQIRDQSLLTCADREVGGYPFSLSVGCSSYRLSDPRTGLIVEGTNAETDWHVYTPHLAYIKTAPNIHFKHAQLDQGLDISASDISGLVHLDPFKLVRQISFRAQDATLKPSDEKLKQFTGDMTAKELTIRVQPKPDHEQDLNLSFAASELSMGQIPVVTGELSLTAANGVDAIAQLSGNPVRIWLEQSGELKDVKGWLEIGRKTLKLDGALSIDEKGMANGTMILRILNPSMDDMQLTQSQAAPAKRDNYDGLLTAIQLMGKPVQEGNLVGSEIAISIVKGKIKAGMLPLGSLPAIR